MTPERMSGEKITRRGKEWYHSGMPPVVLRWVLLRDPRGKFASQALLCTDTEATPEQIIAWFVHRWQLETTFQEVRTPLASRRKGNGARRPLHGKRLPCRACFRWSRWRPSLTSNNRVSGCGRRVGIAKNRRRFPIPLRWCVTIYGATRVFAYRLLNPMLKNSVSICWTD